MSFNSALLNLDQLYLEIFDPVHPSAAYSTSGARWRATLNQLALDAFLPWLREEYAPHARPWLNSATLPTVWEFVNGTVIAVDTVRMVLIPSDAIDTDELRVPQEWLDLPTWAADYYVAVQVNPDDGWMRVWGYTTHHRLKTQGNYDPSDRAYTLPEDSLFHDINTLWLARELCPNEALRAEVPALPSLPASQAANLIERLSDPTIAFPRQAIPFPLWGAVLEHGGWRKQLYQRRQGMPEQWSITQWLQSGISMLAEQVGWAQAELQPAIAFRSLPTTVLTRQLTIAANSYQLSIAPLPEHTTPEASAWRFELRSSDPAGRIPPGFMLRLLTEDLQPFEHNQDQAIEPVEALAVEVLVAPNEGLVWEVEPTPEGCDREILTF